MFNLYSLSTRKLHALLPPCLGGRVWRGWGGGGDDSPPEACPAEAKYKQRHFTSRPCIRDCATFQNVIRHPGRLLSDMSQTIVAQTNKCQ